MGKFTILEWNIRGAASFPWLNKYEIKTWIVDKVLDELPDCIVLTEFVIAKGWDYLQSKLEQKKYIWFVTSSTGGNGVLIAVRRNKGLDYTDIREYKPDSVLNNEVLLGKDVPDYLEIRVKYDNKLFSLIGVRIRKDIHGTNPNYTRNQFALLDDYLSSLKHNVICVGDFNAYWAGKWSTNKNYTLPKTSRNYTLHTPVYNVDDWYSFVQSDGTKTQLDHLITNVKYKQIDVCYVWDFVNNSNGYAELTKSDYKNIKGIPDHAILKAEITF